MELVEDKRSSLEGLADEIATLTQRRDDAARALKAAKTTVELEIARLGEQRSAQCLVVPGVLLDAYERKRKARPNGAIAKR